MCHNVNTQQGWGNMTEKANRLSRCVLSDSNHHKFSVSTTLIMRAVYNISPWRRSFLRLPGCIFFLIFIEATCAVWDHWLLALASWTDVRHGESRAEPHLTSTSWGWNWSAQGLAFVWWFSRNQPERPLMPLNRFSLPLHRNPSPMILLLIHLFRPWKNNKRLHFAHRKAPPSLFSLSLSR